jgi:hypothetical protein
LAGLAITRATLANTERHKHMDTAQLKMILDAMQTLGAG